MIEKVRRNDNPLATHPTNGVAQCGFLTWVWTVPTLHVIPAMKLFLDTMIWLHYRPIEDIPIEAFAPDAKDVTVVVPRITLRELDKHKNQHRSGKVRERARRMLQLVEELGGQPSVKFKNGVGLELYQHPPTIDFAKHGLDREIADEYLIATVLAYVGENSSAAVRLYTEDTTPRMTAKTLGVDARAFPAEYKLEPELDPVEKENRELKNELMRLKSARPILDCTFVTAEGRGKILSCTWGGVPVLDEEKLKAEVQKLRDKHPHQHPPYYGPASDPVRAMLKNIQESSGAAIPDSEFARYNREVNEFLEEYEAYIRAHFRRMTEEHFSTEICIEVENCGSAPAEDVDVHLHFPDGCLLYEELPDPPEEPSPPEPPRSRQDVMFSSMVPAIPSSLLRDHLPLIRPVSGFSIRKTNSYDVRDKFARIKHGHAGKLSNFIMTFGSLDSANSFQIDYRITAANLPSAVEGSLNVVVTK